MHVVGLPLQLAANAYHSCSTTCSDVGAHPGSNEATSNTAMAAVTSSPADIHVPCAVRLPARASFYGLDNNRPNYPSLRSTRESAARLLPRPIEEPDGAANASNGAVADVRPLCWLTRIAHALIVMEELEVKLHALIAEHDLHPLLMPFA